MEQILIHNTRGKDDVERATLAFVVANAAVASNQKATVLLTIEGVRVATQGYADNLQADGFEPLSRVIEQFAAGGGQIWVCGACAKPRGITQEHLVDGAHIVGAAAAVEALASGAQTLSF